ncbi:glycosly transferase [Salmonella enterica subsp. enterica serovar Choleraesuis]|nr:glycosly transferase [Salmonella enterica subsp. enterica serovar Choleraesuis]
MNDLPLISVLMPAYNVECYIEEAINSLLCQSYKNIEIIAVDDCSTDSTFSKLQSLAAIDSRIKPFKKEYNSGIVDTLNIGLTYCSGCFIARMDADDIAEKNRIELQYNFLLENSAVDIVGSATTTIDMFGNPIQVSNVPVGQKKISSTIALFSPCFHIWLCNREIYDRLNGYRKLAPAEDYDFLLRAQTAGFKIDNIPLPLMKIRCRDGNTADIAGLKQRKAHNYVLRLYLERIKKGSDTYSHENFERAVWFTQSEAKNYNKSISLIKSGFGKKSKLVRNIYFLRAALSSKWQFKYSLNRLLFKLKLMQ